MSETLLVASRKGLFTVRRGREKRWSVTTRQFLGDHLSLVSVDPRGLGVWFAAFEHGHFGPKLVRSRDEGKTWEEIAKPTYPEKPAGEVDKDPFRGTDIPWSVKRIWALEPGTPDTPGKLWLGTIPGGLFTSDDNGDSWTLVRSLWDHPDRKRWTGGGADMAGLHSVCVDPRDDKHVTVGVSIGGAWITHDGGLTWKVGGKGMKARYMPEGQQDDPVAQDPHILVQCAAKPDVLWAQHHCGVFRSTDGAASWQEIEQAGPSTFGFAVAVHPQQPDTAWFVPAQKDEQRIPVGGKLVVTRTRDGGKSFEVLTRGLPQDEAWDLVFRHALVVDESGDTLAFGSTTGSLYISNDGGDSWQCVSEHLPPIDSLRFA
jgi:hypothetical protein